MVDRERKIVQHRMDADTEQLYGPIKEAVKYLQKMVIEHADKKDFGLEEHWTGYENMDMTFSWMGPETDQQYESRIFQEEYQEKRDREKNEAERKRKAFEKEQAALKRKYGM